MTTERIVPPVWWPRRDRCAELLAAAIARTFAPEARERVAKLLDRTYPLTREEARIGLCLVFLSNGDEKEIEREVNEALRDWRDIIVAAENTRVNAARFFAWIEELDASV